MSTTLPLAHDRFGPASADKTPVVLIHGFPLDRRIFAELAPLLAAGRPVLTVDLAGFGQSRLDTAFSLDDQARYLRASLKEQGVGPFVLAGLSMGGYVALAYHRLFAPDLKGLILIDTKSTADTPEAKQGREKMADLARREGAAAVANQMEPKMLCQATKEKKPHVVKQLLEIMHACPPATIAAACLAMRDRPDYTPDLGRMQVPLLMITGADDAIAPPNVGKSVAQAAGQHGTYTEIPAAGHIATMEQPQATADAIGTWLTARGL